MWKCKNCDNTYSRRYDLLKHYKLDHLHYGRGHAYPCTYENCPCTCKTWKALLTHLSKSHPAQQSLQKDSFSLFKCHICDNNQLPNETDYFRHIGQHLKNHETVTCMFAGCSYKTNVYGAFNTHKWRKHTPYTIRDLKRGVVDRPVDNIADNPLVESFETREQLCNDFGNMFVNLTSTAVIKDLSVIKVVELNPDSTVVLYPVDPTVSSFPSAGQDNYDDSSESAHTDDTVLFSSSSPESLRTQQWPKVFQIPLFSYDTESQLQRANAEYMKSQTRLTPGSKMLSDILERLSEKIYTYKAYPTDADFSEVAEALTRKHPCLREPGSFNESYGWKQRLKIKMANYRTLLKSHNTSAELTVNSLKSKSQEEAYPAKCLKRPRRAEVNHFPSLPSGETPESLEQERISLLTELQKRNNRQTVKEKMAKTFGYRRQEIVHKKPSIEDVLDRWPALFQMEEINAEFLRITTVPLEAKFFASFDKHSSKLLELIRKKAGVVKERTASILQILDETVDINIRRECILKALMIYLGEPVQHLIRESQNNQESEAAVLDQTAMAIFISTNDDPLHPTKDIKIIIDGVEVLAELPSVATAFAMLFGLIYTLNLRYPKQLQFTFEFVQKVLMELEAKKMTTKVNRLNTQLYRPE